MNVELTFSPTQVLSPIFLESRNSFSLQIVDLNRIRRHLVSYTRHYAPHFHGPEWISGQVDGAEERGARGSYS
jgi:hypothetical protein